MSRVSISHPGGPYNDGPDLPPLGLLLGTLFVFLLLFVVVSPIWVVCALARLGRDWMSRWLASFAGQSAP